MIKSLKSSQPIPELKGRQDTRRPHRRIMHDNWRPSQGWRTWRRSERVWSSSNHHLPWNQPLITNSQWSRNQRIKMPPAKIASQSRNQTNAQKNLLKLLNIINACLPLNYFLINWKRLPMIIIHFSLSAISVNDAIIFFNQVFCFAEMSCVQLWVQLDWSWRCSLE